MRAVWKSMDAPSLRMWIRDYICLKGKKTKKDFVKLWEPNINIIKDGNVSFAWKENMDNLVNVNIWFYCILSYIGVK